MDPSDWIVRGHGSDPQGRNVQDVDPVEGKNEMPVQVGIHRADGLLERSS